MHKTLQDKNLGAMLKFNILTFELFCDTVRWPIVGSARVEICILQSGDETRRLGPEKIAGVDKNLPDVLIRKQPSQLLQVPLPQVV